MKVFVTGVGGQLGHDVMNELYKRSYEGVGSDLAPQYSGIQDGSAVCNMTYVPMDITNGDMVRKVLEEVNPDVVIAVGHSEATPAQIRVLKHYGICLQTHCMNATGRHSDWLGTRGSGPDEACLCSGQYPLWGGSGRSPCAPFPPTGEKADAREAALPSKRWHSPPVRPQQAA
jgi:hypothetical protein